ncbi:hypothetical protein MBLNU457_1911t1 [Dothideomycetes sp. NU457]
MLLFVESSRRVHIRHGITVLRNGIQPRRHLLTLAIESSCDDTSVAVLESNKTRNGSPVATLHFHEKVTANTNAFQGIHPIVALESHQSSLAPLVQKAIEHLPVFSPNDPVPSVSNLLPGSHDGQLRKKPDFVSVTRGPGMRSNLSVGLDTAKGLSLAWNVPLLGVHHMQAHALTPRLVSALSASTPKPGLRPQLTSDGSLKPDFPFLSLLVSGGHSMLISTTGITDHSILASTGDIALGDCLDKAARAILPAEAISTPYGRALENFAFPKGESSYAYTPPKDRGQELERRKSAYGWSFGPPLAESKGGRSSKRMEYSFAGLLTAVERFMRLQIDPSGTPTSSPRDPSSSSIDERREMAREVQRVAFEHLAGRVLLHLSSLERAEREKVKNLVVSGGVAANSFLRHVFRSILDARGYKDIELSFPPIELCTDNAAMIAWAGCEMWDAGWRSELSIRPIRKWSLDAEAEDGGILGVEGWARR